MTFSPASRGPRTMDELRKLFSEAYEQAPHKGNFCSELAILPGVACFNNTLSFCEGYLKSLLDNNLSQPDEYQILSFYGAASGFERHFLLKDTTHFVEACTKMLNRDFVRVPTPRGVLVKMVKLRLDKACAYDANPLVHTRVLNSRAACVAWCNENTSWQFKRGRKALEEVTIRNDIPDDVYQEAWNLFEVDQVMGS